MLALGFSVALYLVLRRARTEGLDPEVVLNVSTYVILAALIGSRLFHVFFEEPAYYFANPMDAIKIWKGGYTFYGGLIPAALVMIWYFRKHKIPVLKSIDVFAPYLALGQMFGRIGCTLAGCCHGIVAPFLFFPVSYVVTNPASFSRPLGVPLYATQLWQAAGNFLIFCILIALRKKKKFDGQIIATYLVLYAIIRGVIEIFRGDDVRGFLIPDVLTTSQGIGIIMIICAGFIYWRAERV